MNIIEVLCVNHTQDELQDNQTLIGHQKWKKNEKSAFKRITYYYIRKDKETEKTEQESFQYWAPSALSP